MASEQFNTAAEGQQATDDYCLYIFPFSIYSIMARATLAFGQAAAVSATAKALSVGLKLVNLHREENISETYLIKISAKGQVPALTGGALSSPLTDSLDISVFFCQHYPGLLPEKQTPFIKQLLQQLHQIQMLSLSVPSKEDRAEGVPCPTVDALLAGTEISPKYRDALQNKRKYHKETQENALTDDNVHLAENQAKALLAEVDKIISTAADKAGALPEWIFGEAVGPTVLDAHCTAFIARLMDCGRHDLVPDRLQKYACSVMTSPGWQSVTHGRSTMWDVSVGHVHLLKDL